MSTRYTIDLDDAQVDEVRALLPAGALRKKPARRRRETEDFTATVRRMLSGLSKRAEGDVDQLPALVELRELVEDVIQHHIDACRRVEVPWSEIAERTGTTKQGAQQRYGRRKAAGERQSSVDDPALPFGD